MDSADTEAAITEADFMTPTMTPTMRRRVAFALDTNTDMEVDFVLVRDIPKIKYHERPLRFLSEPGITQKEYQRRLLSMSRW